MLIKPNITPPQKFKKKETSLRIPSAATLKFGDRGAERNANDPSGLIMNVNRLQKIPTSQSKYNNMFAPPQQHKHATHLFLHILRGIATGPALKYGAVQRQLVACSRDNQK